MSIRQNGLLQNLVVREVPEAEQANGVRYWIVAGERRWRAIDRETRLGGVSVWPKDRLVPCKVVSADEGRHTEVALVENLVRSELTQMEEARGFQTLHEVHQVPTAVIARMVRRTQRFVQQRLQLLELTPEQQRAVDAKTLKVEDARKLLAKPAAPTTPPEPEPAPLLEAMGDPRARSSEEEPPVGLATTPGEMEGSSPSRPANPDDEPAEIPGDCSLLLAAVLKYPGCGLTAYASVGGCGSDGVVARRLNLLAGEGLIDRPRAPTITPRGRQALDAHVAVVLERARGRDTALGADRQAHPDDLGVLVTERLVAARAALAGDGSVIAGIRRVHHDSLWEPAVAAAFLERVLDALTAQQAPRRARA